MYRIGFLIDLLPFAPVAGSDYANDVLAVRESHRQHATFDLAEAVIALLSRAMCEILSDYSLRIREGALCRPKRYSMLGLIL